jgi:hypothetical protein
MSDLIRCRDCRHWQLGIAAQGDLYEYPRNQPPDKGWLDGTCDRLLFGIVITCLGGRDGCTIGRVETDANFGCIYGEPHPTTPPPNEP